MKGFPIYVIVNQHGYPYCNCDTNRKICWDRMRLNYYEENVSDKDFKKQIKELKDRGWKCVKYVPDVVKK